MPNQPYSPSINVLFTGVTSSFTPSAPKQQVYVLNAINPNFLRYWTLSQDSITLVHNSASVVFPLNGPGGLAYAAASASSGITWPPVIIFQPTSSTVTHTASFYFTISASAETPITSYQWSWNSQSLSSFSNCTQSYFTGSTTANLTCSISTVNIQNSASFVCVVNNASGGTSSSIVQSYIL